MEYEELLGSFVTTPIIDNPVIINNLEYINSDLWEPVRGHKFNGTVKPNEHNKDVEIALETFFEYGYDKFPAVSNNFVNVLKTFRTYLDFYHNLIETKIFSRDEIYVRSLRDKLQFTKFIKKSRQASLQNKIALDDVILDEEHIHPEYTGYDSIIHERYLIPWDDTDDIHDWHYSLIPDEGGKDPSNAINEYLKNIDVSKIETFITPFDPYKGSKSTDNAKGKHYLRDTWTRDTYGPYMATRRVIPTQPGSTRDTGVPDPYTLNKIREINQIARAIGEQKKYIANVPINLLERRLEQMTKCQAYIHLDFKKYGLTFRRDILNCLLKRVGREDLMIDQFILNVDGQSIRTNRGGVLGWFDSAVAIVVSAIICDVVNQYNIKTNHIIFNDDVEIGVYGKDAIETAKLLKEVIIEELEDYGFFISHKRHLLVGK